MASVIAGSIAILVTISGCQTIGGLDTSEDTDTTSESDPSGRISKPFYSPFFDRGDHLKELVEKENFGDACQLYEEQRTYFENAENRKTYLPLLQAIASHYNDPIDKKIAPVLFYRAWWLLIQHLDLLANHK